MRVALKGGAPRVCCADRYRLIADAGLQSTPAASGGLSEQTETLDRLCLEELPMDKWRITVDSKLPTAARRLPTGRPNDKKRNCATFFALNVINVILSVVGRFLGLAEPRQSYRKCYFFVSSIRKGSTCPSWLKRNDFQSKNKCYVFLFWRRKRSTVSFFAFVLHW